MNQVTQTEPGIPEALKRSASEPGQIAPGAKAPTPAKPAVVKAKAAAKQAKSKSGKVVDAKHKPADVVATAANPQKSIVPVAFKTKYAAHDGSNGDRISAALKSACETRDDNGRVSTSLTALAEIAKANGIDMKGYKDLNPGMQRMNVGNRLRGMLRNEKPVVIGKQRFADWEKAKVVEPVKAEQAAA